MDTNLINKLTGIKNRYSDIIQILENNSENSKYKKIYKGFMTFQSEVNPNPDILFLGINPGYGAFNEENNFSKEIIFPKRIISDANYIKELKLDWFKKGVSRGEFIKKKWFAYDWFENSKKINNSFPARMIDLLFSYTEKLHPDKKSKRNEIKEIIENDIQYKIVYTNINPIATKSIKELNDIINKLSKEKDIEKIIGCNDKATPNDIKNFFRQRTIDFINEINPKVIVLLGHTAYQNLTLLNDYKGKKVIKNHIQLRKNDPTKYKIISFSRQGNWSTLIDNITTAIIED
jgi:hypothetical protein